MTNPYQIPGQQPDPYGNAADPYAQGQVSGNYNASPSPYEGQPSSYGTPAPAPQYNTYESQGYAVYGQQQPYAAPGIASPGYGAVLPDHPQSTTVLILGILSIVGIAVCGPFAWYFGSKARKEIQANPGTYKDGGSLTAGWVMGIIGTVLLILAVVGIIVYIIFVAVLFASFGSYS
jgi:hypothetical protein